MKTYYDHNTFIVFECASIPKDPANMDYARFLKELEKGEAKVIPYTKPAPTWAEIKSKRDQLLKESDWVVLADANPKPSKDAWLNYRQELRDIPQKYTDPSKVVWPEKP